MKNLISSILFTFCLFVTGNIMAQVSGTISYSETIKLDIQLPDGMEVDGLDKSMTMEKTLAFKDKISIYKDQEKNNSNDRTMTSDDGGFQITFQMDDSEDIFHTDFQTKITTHQTGFMGKEFIIESELTKYKWKLTGEKIKYLDYVCQKAEMILEENGKEVNVVAWFTSEIPVSVGPDMYNQLPGAILMISKNDGKKEIKATAVNLKSLDDEIFELPKKGKKVTAEEYDQIVEEKTKELQRELGGDETIIIRG